jgi:hypothetical protein
VRDGSRSNALQVAHRLPHINHLHRQHCITAIAICYRYRIEGNALINFDGVDDLLRKTFFPVWFSLPFTGVADCLLFDILTSLRNSSIVNQSQASGLCLPGLIWVDSLQLVVILRCIPIMYSLPLPVFSTPFVDVIAPNLHRLASFFPSNFLSDHFEYLYLFSGPLLLLVILLLHGMWRIAAQ